MHNKTIGLDSIPSNLAIDLADELSDEVIGGGGVVGDLLPWQQKTITYNIPEIILPEWYYRQREAFNNYAPRNAKYIEAYGAFIPAQPQKDFMRSQPGFRWDLIR